MEYIPRIVDEELRFRLDAFGAVLIAGPKWCGKTTTALQQAKSVIYMQDPDKRDEYMASAAVKPSFLLEGDNPRLIDEWQEAPVIWDAVRMSVDRRQEDGLYILTGSNSVDTSKIMHTGIGRISRIEMSTMSLYESGESNGKISLARMFDDPDMDIDGVQSDLTVEELIFAACRGGWPSVMRKKSDRAKLAVAYDYVREVCETDISTIDGITRNPSWTRLLLASYSRNISTPAKKNVIYKDIVANAESMSINTFDAYHNALERLYVINDIDAWCPNIRSATVIRSGKKRGFSDPSIAVAALGANPKTFYTELKTFGFIFESLCLRDLKVYSAPSDGRLSYYRDRYGLEADAVLHLRDGRYALIEIKLGSNDIEEGATHLNEIERLVAEYNKSETQVPLRMPDLKIVLTGTNTGYRRSDGVYVIPIGCLKE